MNEQLIKFIELCLMDGVVTDKEREVIFRKSKELGVPEDECEIILEGHIFTPEIKSIMLASKVLKSNKNKKEVKNDLLSNMAPPIIQSCNTISSFDDPLAEIELFQFPLILEKYL